MQKRVKFDFDIAFSNGGCIKGSDFRLDITGDSISDKELAEMIIADMRLLLVSSCKILNKEIISEAHKRSVSSAKETLIDLSHTIDEETITYKGLPAPIICDFLSREDSRKNYDEGTEFQIGKIEMVANTGTYIDVPFHRYAHGKDLNEVGLEAFTDLEGILVHVPYTEHLAIDETHFKGLELKDKAVLVRTDWAQHWKTDAYFENNPFLTEGAALFLRDAGAKLVGIDSHNIDDTRTRLRPAHTVLLGAEIMIVEHLCNLELVPTYGFTFTAAPPKFKGVGTFPVRAMAKLHNV